MKIIAMMHAACAAVAMLLVACTPPPAWSPGDDPLAVAVSDDAVWGAVSEACARWSMTGLACVRVPRGEERVWIHAGSPGAAARAGETSVSMGAGGWEFDTVIRPDVLSGEGWPEGVEKGREVMTHEMGHLLGLGHLQQHGTLMFQASESPVPTTADLDALGAEWGEAPWETP